MKLPADFRSIQPGVARRRTLDQFNRALPGFRSTAAGSAGRALPAGAMVGDFCRKCSKKSIVFR